MTTGSFGFEPAEILAYHDDFNGGDAPLEGAAEPGEDDFWIQSVEDGAYRYVNTSKGSAVRFIDLSSVPFAFGRDDTDGATPAARVAVSNSPDGGIGLLIGHPHSSNYALFAVGSNHRRVVSRGDRCGLPHATPDAWLVLGGFYESAAVSTVTVASEIEHEAPKAETPASGETGVSKWSE